jgi:hypothetical protein
MGARVRVEKNRDQEHFSLTMTMKEKYVPSGVGGGCQLGSVVA